MSGVTTGLVQGALPPQASLRDLGEHPLKGYLSALSEDEPLLRARLWIGIAFIAGDLARRTRALEAAIQAIACARAGGDAGVLAEALRGYATNATILRRFDDAERALAEAEALPGPSTAQRLRLLDTRALLSALRGNPAGAVRAFELLLTEHRSLGNAGAVRSLTLNLAENAHASGETERAIELLRDVLRAVRAAADRFSEASAIAREVIRQLAPRELTAVFIAIALESIALAVALGGDFARAAFLEGYADAAQRAQGYEREFTETTTHDRLSAVLTERLAPDDVTRRLAEGAALAPQAAIAFALAEP